MKTRLNVLQAFNRVTEETIQNDYHKKLEQLNKTNKNTVNREQIKENRKHRTETENREQRKENKEQRTENREQRTENREQRTENREQRTQNLSLIHI